MTRRLELLENRKPARTVAEVPTEVRLALSRGEIAGKTLTEMLAIDMGLLFAMAVGGLGVGRAGTQAKERFKPYETEKIMAQLRGGGLVLSWLHQQVPEQNILERLSRHRSDLVRSWACFAVGQLSNRSVARNFAEVRPFAADAHMGVRESAWMTLRPLLVNDFERAKAKLLAWAKAKDVGVRRCAIEATRPRGVWCAHFPAMREDPAQAIDLLSLVRADSQRYVQNSVANWLNDASKDNPKWVIRVCREWERDSSSKATAYIINRALRTIRKSTT